MKSSPLENIYCHHHNCLMPQNKNFPHFILFFSSHKKALRGIFFLKKRKFDIFFLKIKQTFVIAFWSFNITLSVHRKDIFL